MKFKDYQNSYNDICKSLDELSEQYDEQDIWKQYLNEARHIVSKSEYKLLNEKFIEKFKSIFDSDYELLTVYGGENKRVKIKHIKCDRAFKVYPRDLDNEEYKTCPNCNKERTIEILKKHGDVITGEFVNNQTPVEVLSKKTGISRTIKPIYIIRNVKQNTKNKPIKVLNQNYTKPKRKKRTDKSRKTTEDFIKEIHMLGGDQYTILGEYVNNKTKIKVFNSKTNRIIYPTPHDLIRRCKKRTTV